MTELEKAMYADVKWLEASLDVLNENPGTGTRSVMRRAAKELADTVAKYLNEPSPDGL